MYSNSTDAPPVPEHLTELVPSLVEVFGIIVLGYFVGRVGLLTSHQNKGIGIYSANIAMSTLLFKSMAVLKFNDVNWCFLGALAIGKCLVFLITLVIAALVIRPINWGKLGIYAIFVTQSHDIALGVPIVQSIYMKSNPSFVNYIYLIAPVSVAFLNPIGFFLLEFHKFRSSYDSNRNFFKVFITVFARVISSPIVFMTLLGIIANFVFGHTILGPFQGILDVIGNSFTATALFTLGHNMVGKFNRNSTGAKDGSVTPMLLIGAKMILTPLIIREVVELLVSNSDPLKVCFSTYGFVYGSLPTAPTVFIYATLYGMQADMMASGMVISTFLSGPLLYLYGKMLSMANRDIHAYVPTIEQASLGFSVVSLISIIIVLVIFIFQKKWKSSLHLSTIILMIFQLLLVTGYLPFYNDTNHTRVTLILSSIVYLLGYFGTRLIPIYMALIYFMLKTKKSFISKKVLIIFACAILCLVITITVIILFNMDMDYALHQPEVCMHSRFGSSQQYISLVILSLEFVSITVLLITAHHHRHSVQSNPVIAINDDEASSNYDDFQSEQTSQSIIIPNSRDDHTSSHYSLTPRCESFLTNKYNLPEDMRQKSLRLNLNSGDSLTTGSLINLGCDTIAEGAVISKTISNSNRLLDQDQSKQLSSSSNDRTVEEIVPDVTTLYGESSYININMYQLPHHLILLLLCLLSSLVSLSIYSWTLMKQKATVIFIQLVFLEAAITFGQGFFLLAIFGVDYTACLYPLFQSLLMWINQKKSFSLPEWDDVDEITKFRCEQFIRYHKEDCEKIVLRDIAVDKNTLSNIFLGAELVDWLLERGLFSERKSAVDYGSQLLNGRVITHIDEKYHFYDGPYIYTFADNDCY